MPRTGYSALEGRSTGIRHPDVMKQTQNQYQLVDVCAHIHMGLAFESLQL